MSHHLVNTVDGPVCRREVRDLTHDLLSLALQARIAADLGEIATVREAACDLLALIDPPTSARTREVSQQPTLFDG